MLAIVIVIVIIELDPVIAPAIRTVAVVASATAKSIVSAA